jgi:hypothetical protein
MSAQITDVVAYTMSYLGFKWVMYDEHGNVLGSFEGTSTDAITQAMRIVIDRGDFGTGDWFLAGTGEYEFRRYLYTT